MRTQSSRYRPYQGAVPIKILTHVPVDIMCRNLSRPEFDNRNRQYSLIKMKSVLLIHELQSHSMESGGAYKGRGTEGPTCLMSYG